MTTDNIVEIKRDINVLLSLDTYQGMTDEEIQSIIDYKVERAVRERDSSELVKVVTETSKALVNESKKRYEDGMKNYNEILEKARIK